MATAQQPVELASQEHGRQRLASPAMGFGLAATVKLLGHDSNRP